MDNVPSVHLTCNGFGYDGKRWILIDEVSQRMLRIGQHVLDFRGERHRVTGKGQPPQKPSSTGKVELDGVLYYHSIIGAQWVKL